MNEQLRLRTYLLVHYNMFYADSWSPLKLTPSENSPRSYLCNEVTTVFFESSKQAMIDYYIGTLKLVQLNHLA